MSTQEPGEEQNEATTTSATTTTPLPRLRMKSSDSYVSSEDSSKSKLHQTSSASPPPAPPSALPGPPIRSTINSSTNITNNSNSNTAAAPTSTRQRKNSNDYPPMRKNSSSDGEWMKHIPPVNPFFNASQYDSDGSDGSLIIRYEQQPKGKQPSQLSSSKPSSSSSQQQPQSRDRLPSFDSLASTGSVRYISGSTSQASAVPRQQQSQSTPINPQMLPYNQRKKLLLQRQQQRRSQQQQPQPVPAPVPVSPYAPPGMPPQMNMPGMPPFMMPMPGPEQMKQPFTMPSPEQMAAFHHQAYQMGFPPPPFPGFPQGMPPQFQQPGGPPPQFQQPGGPPPQFQQPGGPLPQGFPQQGGQFRQPPPGAQGFPPGGGGMPPQGYPPGAFVPPNFLPFAPPPFGFPPQQPQQPPPPQQQHQQQQQRSSHPQEEATPSPQAPRKLAPYRHTQQHAPPPQQQQQLPPSGSKPKRSQQAPHLPQVPQFPPSKSQRRPPFQVQRSFSQESWSDSDNLQRDKESPPPPPPQNAYHVHADSTGTVSSLGSYGVGSPSFTDEQGGGGGFLDMLRDQWSPRQSPHGKKAVVVNANDFHRKSQDFLTQNRPQPPSRPGPGLSPGPSQQIHRRAGSASQDDRPPASRGTHKRLTSISNDDWEKEEQESGEEASLSSNEELDDERGFGSLAHPDERTSLLPPTGISTNEHDGKQPSEETHKTRRSKKVHRVHRQAGVAPPPDQAATKQTYNQAMAAAFSEQPQHQASSKPSSRKNRKAKKKSRRKQRSRQVLPGDDSYSEGEEDSKVTEESSHEYKQWTKKRARMLDKERAKLMEQWKAEARAEAEMAHKEEEAKPWTKRIRQAVNAEMGNAMHTAFRMFTFLEAFIANLPLTIGAVAMAVVTLGIVWFKFAEENMDSCEPVHFHSSQCTFPEFPGCFYCDKTARMYQVAIAFLFTCKFAAGVLAMLLALKILLATRVVLDEMSSPTTSSPAGLLCMTTVCVFAGRGFIGQVMVTLATCTHLGLVFWFIYMALAYHIMPEPSWYPNTVGIGLSAVKMWLYYPMPGHLLMAISLSLNFFFFPISLIRVAINEKISATVGWMQMSAPAISLYALTIMAQPSFEEEHPDVTRFQVVHRMIYLPCMHVMCMLSVMGFLASVHSLWVRWDNFKKKEFSPAHAAFCFPTLSHANAIQAYRGAVNNFSDIPANNWRMQILYTYWVIVLVGGTIATLCITAKFLYCLPKWTVFDLEDEEEPPAPYETLMSLQDMVTAGETLRQPFVSPAVLQANETGALVLTRVGPDRQLRYVRTRRLAALGFEPTMDWSEMEHERKVLLEWVGKHPPRRRHRTLSVPGIDFNYGNDSSSGGYPGVYGGQQQPHPFSSGNPLRRAGTESPGRHYY